MNRKISFRIESTSHLRLIVGVVYKEKKTKQNKETSYWIVRTSNAREAQLSNWILFSSYFKAMNRMFFR